MQFALLSTIDFYHNSAFGIKFNELDLQDKLVYVLVQKSTQVLNSVFPFRGISEPITNAVIRRKNIKFKYVLYSRPIFFMLSNVLFVVWGRVVYTTALCRLNALCTHLTNARAQTEIRRSCLLNLINLIMVQKHDNILFRTVET